MSRKKVDVITRIMRRLDTSDPEACWPWPGSELGGYGRVYLGTERGRSTYVSRVLVAHHEGLPLDGNWVARHSCDNPPCCNPAHLRSGSVQDNHDDQRARGRQPRGERSAVAKYSDDHVATAKRLRKDGVSVSDIAQQTGISWGHLYRIFRGEAR